MAFRVRTLNAADPPDSFPDPVTARPALGYPDGLIAIGGDLSPERLIAAYSSGIFPWYNEDQPILWWSPDPRAIIVPEKFHMSRSLARTLRRGGWEYSLNQDFCRVIEGCANARGEHGTWITAEMQDAYAQMHALGYAHSIESWFNGELAGGIYGIRLGKVFFGESMFTTLTSGSKVAISGLISLCLSNGITLLDCQMASEHLTTLGMQEVSRKQFLQQLQPRVAASPDGEWQAFRTTADSLSALRQ